jgi:hypothetical protein
MQQVLRVLGEGQAAAAPGGAGQRKAADEDIDLAGGSDKDDDKMLGDVYSKNSKKSAGKGGGSSTGTGRKEVAAAGAAKGRGRGRGRVRGKSSS